VKFEVKFLRNLLLALFLAGLAGCATTGSAERDPRDPLEPFNRAVYNFNETFDQALARPIATAYRDLLHEEIRNRVRNFFSNIADVFIGVNNMLQGKFQDGVEDWARFAFNSTIGLLGIHDVATDMGIDKHNEDFGQTLGRWGVGDGAYLVLPILGPSTLRDGVGTGLDIYTDPVGDFRPMRVRNSAVVLRLVNTRADLLDASRLLEEAALDKYVFLRDAYLQRRRSLIYDGRPPRDDSDRPSKEDRNAEAPVNPGPGASVEGNLYLGNVYLPRVPRNYETVLATLPQKNNAPSR
jgi:phospholipid-binding lipoprotein MlaA